MMACDVSPVAMFRFFGPHLKEIAFKVKVNVKVTDASTETEG